MLLRPSRLPWDPWLVLLFSFGEMQEARHSQKHRKSSGVLSLSFLASEKGSRREDPIGLTTLIEMSDEERNDTLAKLNADVNGELLPGALYRSWVRGEYRIGTPEDLPTPRCRFFDEHGFVFIERFCDAGEVQAMKDEMSFVVEEEWDPSADRTQVFRTDEKQVDAQAISDYFLDSCNRTSFFAEKDAIIEETGELKEDYKSNKILALNKAGHGTHTSDGAFKDYATSEKVRSLLRELGWKAPVVPQSMYIFKQAKIGGEVTSHQDSTFLYTTPRQTCVGLWLALDDATVDNGFLWVRPGSHRERVRRQFVRNPEHFGDTLDYTGTGVDRSQPQMVFKQLEDDGSVGWEGKLPENLKDAGFIPVPCKAGDLLAFVGTLDHLSLPNRSGKARHTFQLHCVEGEKEKVTWSKENWLQYPEGVPFMEL